MASVKFPSIEVIWEKVLLRFKFFAFILNKWTLRRIQVILLCSISSMFLGYCLFWKNLCSPVLRWVLSQKKDRVKVSFREKDFRRLDLFAYRFKSQFMILPDMFGLGEELEMHYVDEGPMDAKEVVLCLHGQTSWSFLFRKVINHLKKDVRVIAIDFIGSGMSDKLTSVENYSFGFHVKCLNHLIEDLDLKGITILGEDWGALVGVCAASANPDNFKRFAFLNAGIPTGKIFGYDLGDDRDSSLTLPEILSSSLLKINWKLFFFFFGNLNMPRFSIYAAETEDLHYNTIEMYDSPFPTGDYRAGFQAWSNMYPFFQDHENYHTMIKVRDFLKNWTKPTLVVLSDKDKIVSDGGLMIMKLIKSAKFTHIKKSGVLVPENKGEKLGDRIFDFLSGKDGDKIHSLLPKEDSSGS